MYFGGVNVTENPSSLEESSRKTRKPNGPAQAAAAERWLTVAGVADHLAVSRDTVEALIRSADLVAVDVSPNYRDRRHRAAWRVSPADLEIFLQARRNAAATPVTRPARRRPKGEVVEFV